MHKHQRQHREGIQQLLRVVGRGKGLEWSLTIGMLELTLERWAGVWQGDMDRERKGEKKPRSEAIWLPCTFLPALQTVWDGWCMGVLLYALCPWCTRWWFRNDGGGGSGGQWEVKLESCRSRRRKTVLYGSPRHLESILWQSKSLKDY